MSPRPILKHHDAYADPPAAAPLPFSTCSSAAMLAEPQVHFPATPTLATMHITHSATTYDRAPIRVQQNACALPDRGCPGRTYVPSDAGKKRLGAGSTKLSGTPRWSAAPMQEGYFPPLSSVPSSSACPELVSDHGSSESDDSDPFTTSPDPALGFCVPSSSTHGKTMYPRYPSLPLPLVRPSSQEDMQKALAFLPHPPSPDRERRRRMGAGESPKVELVHRTSTGVRKRTPSGTAFAAPSDPCLGGF